MLRSNVPRGRHDRPFLKSASAHSEGRRAGSSNYAGEPQYIITIKARNLESIPSASELAQLAEHFRKRFCKAQSVLNGDDLLFTIEGRLSTELSDLLNEVAVQLQKYAPLQCRLISVMLSPNTFQTDYYANGKPKPPIHERDPAMIY